MLGLFWSVECARKATAHLDSRWRRSLAGDVGSHAVVTIPLAELTAEPMAAIGHGRCRELRCRGHPAC